MSWLQILVLLVGNFAWILPLWLWNRAESRADMRHMENKTNMLIESIKQDIKAIHEEIKDFHGRLCAIEERNRK